MKIAITADVHLTSRERNPERYHALENILQQLVNLEIDQLIIAGDLFDSSCKDPSEFERLFQDDQYSRIKVYIIPGNHDIAISSGLFIFSNVKYIVNPEVVKFEKDVEFLFLPYEEGKSVGEVLAINNFSLQQDKWILIAHGDNLSSNRQRNSYDSRIYMPISRRDIQLYHPGKVFLGHIHAPSDIDIVYYPGSPCGMDISEIGRRSFLIYDTATGIVDRVLIATEVIYFKLTLTMIPGDDEETYIQQKIDKHISAWKLDEDQLTKVKLRVMVNGYSTDREKVNKIVINYLGLRHISLNEAPDLNGLKISNDVMRADIAASVLKQINELELIEDSDEPTRDEYILAAMNHIYKG